MIGEIILTVLGVPIGLLVAWLAKDELATGQKWFRFLVIIGLIGALGFWLYGRPEIAWSFGFAGVIALVGLVKSSDKKWVKKYSSLVRRRFK